MIRRELSPITDGHSEVVFARPYNLPALRQMTSKPGFEVLLSDKLYEIRYCPESDLYFQTWVLEQHELADWYSSSDESVFLEEIRREKLHSFAHQTEEVLVLRQLCPAKTPVVLDFGCRWGKWGSMALAYGCDVYGIDVNPNACAFCAERGVKIVSIEQLEELRFDFINCDQVVEHVSDPLGLVRMFSRCLKPGAFLKLSTPANPRLPKLMSAAQSSDDDGILDPIILDPLCPLEHVNLFSRPSLNRLAENAGLAVYRPPFFKWFGAGQLWNMPRQLNRNFCTPFKRWLAQGTYGWFRKIPHESDG